MTESKEIKLVHNLDLSIIAEYDRLEAWRRILDKISIEEKAVEE